MSELAREFEPDAPSVGQARRFLRQALHAHALLADDAGEELGDTLLLAANQLAINAVLHARTEFTVRVVVDLAHVRVEVTDANSRLPQPCLTPADATSGRGLAIVDGSGLHRGITRHLSGQTVWLQAPRLHT